MSKTTSLTLKEIDSYAKEYADNRQILSDRITGLEDELELVRRKHMPSIINAVNKTKKSKEALYAAIDISRGLFNRPKTQSVHGIKFGLQKIPDSFRFEDEEQVIKRIKKFLVNKTDSLVNTKESISKAALKQLSATDLGKIGVVVAQGCEEILIKDTNSEIDKLVSKLLSENEIQKKEVN